MVQSDSSDNVLLVAVNRRRGPWALGGARTGPAWNVSPSVIGQWGTDQVRFGPRIAEGILALLVLGVFVLWPVWVLLLE